jgi:hypothetical protein
MGKKFEKGSFIKRKTKEGGFMIFEGNDVSTSSFKQYTTLCEYDPYKYKMTSIGYDHVPNLEIATRTMKCDVTVDTDCEDYWIVLCTEEEKKRAIQILSSYGYYWDEENLCMIDKETGEVIKKIITPDNTYYGQIIKPISEAFKAMLKRFCILANRKPEYSQSYMSDWEYD